MPEPGRREKGGHVEVLKDLVWGPSQLWHKGQLEKLLSGKSVLAGDGLQRGGSAALAPRALLSPLPPLLRSLVTQGPWRHLRRWRPQFGSFPAVERGNFNNGIDEMSLRVRGAPGISSGVLWKCAQK